MGISEIMMSRQGKDIVSVYTRKWKYGNVFTGNLFYQKCPPMVTVGCGLHIKSSVTD